MNRGLLEKNAREILPATIGFSVALFVVEILLAYVLPLFHEDFSSSILRIEFLHEFPITSYACRPFMEKVDEQMHRLTIHDGCVPLLYSIKATKPETAG